MVAFIFALAALLAAPALSAAHDIPSDVTVQLLVKPHAGGLSVLIRVPLAAMRDVDFPLTPQGYLDTDRLSPQLAGVAKVWLAEFIDVYENGSKLPRANVVATRLTLPSDRSFTSYRDALKLFAAPPLRTGANVSWSQLFFDVDLEYPAGSPLSRFSIDPRLRHLAAREVTVLRFEPRPGVERDFEFQGNPGIVPLDPTWHQAALRFIQLGFEHILDGTDHLLFLFCLVIPLRRFRPLLAVITAFTAAHSITLIASAFGLAPSVLWFPPLIETLIAASIVWMALENIASVKVNHRWIIAFGFGLVHGFGFSFALRETLQFAGSHLLLSLLSFNFGVELGQLTVLAVMIPALRLLFRYVVEPRMGTIILSAFIAHTGWHWMLDRGAVLRRYSFEWPALDWQLLATVAEWTLVAWIVAGAAWLAIRFFRPRPARAES